MNEMVERVAKALRKEMQQQELFVIDTKDCIVIEASYGSRASVEALLYVLARAAITAMREPTDEMASNGSKAANERWYPEDPPDMADGWRAMIDEALK